MCPIKTGDLAGWKWHKLLPVLKVHAMPFGAYQITLGYQHNVWTWTAPMADNWQYIPGNSLSRRLHDISP